ILYKLLPVLGSQLTSGHSQARQNRLGANHVMRYRLGMSLNEMPEIQQLTKEEKLQLVEDLWDAIAATPDDFPVSDQEKKLLDQRLEAHLASPEAALTLDEFKNRLTGKL